MRVGIMQPYFFPYLGHFALIKKCDFWVVFDVSQYTKKSWISRNRIMSQTAEFQYISAPLLDSSINQTIHQIQLVSMVKLKDIVLGKISLYRKNAPYYWEVLAVIERIFAQVDSLSLSRFDVASVHEFCNYLGIKFEYVYCSDLKLNFSSVTNPGGWAPIIASAVGATTYTNPISGLSLFRVSDFEKINVSLEFLDFKMLPYLRGVSPFINNLSIIDVAMWMSPAEIRHALQSHSRIISVTGSI